MLEYSAVLGNDLRDIWAGQILPLIDMVSSSPYFWPGIVAAGVALVLVTRLISK
jgi:hypothetical protein